MRIVFWLFSIFMSSALICPILKRSIISREVFLSNWYKIPFFIAKKLPFFSRSPRLRFRSITKEGNPANPFDFLSSLVFFICIIPSIRSLGSTSDTSSTTPFVSSSYFVSSGSLDVCPLALSSASFASFRFFSSSAFFFFFSSSIASWRPPSYKKADMSMSQSSSSSESESSNCRFAV